MLQARRLRVRFPMSIFQLTWHFQPHHGPMVRLSLKQKWVPGIFLGVKGGRPAHKANSLTAMCEPIV
jgi:hypothetical protein